LLQNEEVERKIIKTVFKAGLFLSYLDRETMAVTTFELIEGEG
jgi:hypothetical protein